MKRRHVILIFFVSLALLLFGAQVRYRSMIVDIPVSQVLFALASFVLVKKGMLKGRRRFILIPISIIFWDLCAFCVDNLFSNDHTWRFFQIGTIHMWLCIVGSIYGSLLASFSKRLRMVGASVLLLSALFSPWYMVRGYDYWTHYCFAGNFTGRTNGTKLPDWLPVVNPGDSLRDGFFKDKYVVLDFWTTSCVGCFRKFPMLDSMTKEYHGNKDVLFWAVNLPSYSDSVQRHQRAKDLNAKYAFQTAMADTSAWRMFDVSVVPTIVVLKNNEMIFKGNIERLKGFLDEEVRQRAEFR